MTVKQQAKRRVLLFGISLGVEIFMDYSSSELGPFVANNFIDTRDTSTM